MDVVEIGRATLDMGGVYRVKPLGVYAMIDDGELDWKVIAINVDDPKADLVNDVEDVERYGGVLDDWHSCLARAQIRICSSCIERAQPVIAAG